MDKRSLFDELDEKVKPSDSASTDPAPLSSLSEANEAPDLDEASASPSPAQQNNAPLSESPTPDVPPEADDFVPLSRSTNMAKSAPVSQSRHEKKRQKKLIEPTVEANAYTYRPQAHPERKKLHYGIEALRILSMLFVVLLHVLGRGGVAAATEAHSASYSAAWLLLSFAYPAVNLYALISGYVGCKSTFRLSKLITLWIGLITVNLVVWGAFGVFSPEIAKTYSLSECLTPICSSEYWYVNAYIGLYLLTPVLNIAIEHLNKRRFQLVLGSMFVLFVLLPAISKHDLFLMHTGYSALWLIVMYLVGGYIRIHVHRPVRRSVAYTGLASYVLLSLFIFVQKLVVEQKLFVEQAENPYFYDNYSYTSPYIALSAVGLFLFFVYLNPKKKKQRRLIRFFSQTAFGVYLFHTQPLIWESLITDRFAVFGQYATPAMVLACVAVSIGIFIACALLEKIRALIVRFSGVEYALKRIPFLN